MGDFDIGGILNMVMNPMSMLGGMMGGGGSQQSGGAKGAGGANGSQGTDMMSSMTNPMSMISSIINMCTGGGQGGGSGGSSTTENTSDVQNVPGQGYAATYDQQRASALKNVQKYFDQLDTIAGGSKDGLINRADLTLAQANLSLPKELRDACAFINNNPAEFNQLDVAAGIGSCDGVIGKGDVDAAIAALPKPDSKTDGGASGTSPAPTGSDPTGSDPTNSAYGSDGGEGAGTVDPEPWQDYGTDYTPAPGARESDLRDEAIQKFGSKLDDLQGKIDRLLDKDGDLTPSEQTKLQGYMQKRTELHQLLSNLMEMEHEIKKSIIQNIR